MDRLDKTHRMTDNEISKVWCEAIIEDLLEEQRQELIMILEYSAKRKEAITMENRTDSIGFATVHPDGSVTNKRSIPLSAVRACPQYSMVLDHYREDNTCRCDEGYYDDNGNWVKGQREV